MSISLLLTAAILAPITTSTHAKTVVFFPPPSTSYFVYHTKIAGALASLGHDVWICVPHFLIPKNLVTNKTVKVLQYGEHLGNLEAKIFGSTRMIDKFWDKDCTTEVLSFFFFAREYTKVANDVLSDKSFLDKVKNLKPDLIVLESIPFNLNMLVLPYMLDIPYALVGTFQDIVLSKIPFSPAAPVYPGDNIRDRMTFFQRLQSFFFYTARINIDLFYDSSLVSKFAPHKPYKSINDIAANAEIIIAEVDHVLDYPRPAFPNTKLVGGSSASPATPLVGELKKFVDNANNGIIVVSFGGSVVNVPPHISSKFVSAFKQVDFQVVWAVNITSPDPSQILTSKWIPQNDLLGHEKTKLFISHCGKNGQYEALYHAVPILCLPIFGDQGYNSERVLAKQLGLRADMREVSAGELASMIKQIVYEPKYSENMKKASSLYRELYKVPMKEAAYWLDHVMKYGGAYMRSSAQQMPWYQIYFLDVIAFLVVICMSLLLCLCLLILLTYKIYKDVQRKMKMKKE